jgi:hypothetical protein
MNPIRTPRPLHIWLTEEFQTRLPGLPVPAVPPVVDVAIVPVSRNTAGVVEVALESAPPVSTRLNPTKVGDR